MEPAVYRLPSSLHEPIVGSSLVSQSVLHEIVDRLLELDQMLACHHLRLNHRNDARLVAYGGCPKNRALSRSPYNQDLSILGSILGSPTFGNSHMMQALTVDLLLAPLQRFRSSDLIHLCNLFHLWGAFRLT